MKTPPLTPEWLLANKFSPPADSSIDGYSYFYRYLSGYHALETRLEPRNNQWQWKLAEHRDHMNWDDKSCSLPPTCQPQTEVAAEYLIATLEGFWNSL